MADVIYVVSKDGNPLMPTTRCGRVGYLLRKKQARVVDRIPFTVQLVYETADVVQNLCLGIDPGRTNIGLAVVNTNGECVFSAEVETRNKDVPKKMAERKAHRQSRRHYGRRCKRQRRARKHNTVNAAGEIRRKLPQAEEPIVCKLIKNKEARFCNRKREDGWLTPTANHLLLTHENIIRKLKKFLPISSIAIEVNSFAFMELERGHVNPWDYQRGSLHGYEGVEDAVYHLQDGKCLMCGKPRIDHYHHVVPRHEGGSEGIINRVGLCEKCHNSVHTCEACRKKLMELHEGAKKKYAGTSVLNQIMPRFVEDLIAAEENVFLISGKDTAAMRRVFHLDKEHNVDAYCIAVVGSEVEPRMNNALKHPYQIKQYRRHDRQVCHQAMMDRKYYLNGKCVAVNRRKRFEQKGDSLKEFLEKNTSVRPEMLTVKEHKPTYKRMDRIQPGTVMMDKTVCFVYKTGTPVNNGVPFYAVDTDGKRHTYRSCSPVLNNTGIKILKGRMAV